MYSFSSKTEGDRKSIRSEKNQNQDKFDLDQMESEIVKKLKNNCDEKGREINPLYSAPLLHELGKVYQKRGTDDMLCLIKSAALFNAAIVRCDSDMSNHIEKDLCSLCQLILNRADAKDTHADLIKKSREIKCEFMHIRKWVNQMLGNLPSIPKNLEPKEKEILEKNKTEFIKKLQGDITSKYTSIMADLAKFCEDVMGKVPCKFALVGMGSIARKEITPYSDFENLIVIKNKKWYRLNEQEKGKALDYFRWYSVLFQTVIINLQETILPSVAISSLNDYFSSNSNPWFFDNFTTRGISLDGMMPHACKFPLGRQQHTTNKPWKTELIKPVKEMIEYLHTNENLKNGYHLGDILTKTCFVYGHTKTYQELERGVFEILDDQTRKDNLQCN